MQSNENALKGGGRLSACGPAFQRVRDAGSGQGCPPYSAGLA